MAVVATNGNGGAAVGVKEEMKRKLELEESEDESPVKTGVKQAKTELSRKCPYLDTIDRAVLDFDFEKLCSVSLSRINVYACLVCGKYFQVKKKSAFCSSLIFLYFYSRAEGRTLTPIRILWGRTTGYSSTSRPKNSTVFPTTTRWSTPRWETSFTCSTPPSVRSSSFGWPTAPRRRAPTMETNTRRGWWGSTTSRLYFYTVGSKNKSRVNIPDLRRWPLSIHWELRWFN